MSKTNDGILEGHFDYGGSYVQRHGKIPGVIVVTLLDTFGKPGAQLFVTNRDALVLASRLMRLGVQGSTIEAEPEKGRTSVDILLAAGLTSEEVDRGAGGALGTGPRDLAAGLTSEEVDRGAGGALGTGPRDGPRCWDCKFLNGHHAASCSAVH